ncbi:hypothetical protein Cni_G29362 [Canna indica]|uniref:Diacylglycerol O-acyltransferase n=1 Tax=Canna indica TaxID=4628 RepID=A0AAQ3L743_9LILI|nr:hypothetical protein Cni_G29362 [Canna indica]
MPRISKEGEEEEPVSPVGRLYHQRDFDCYIMISFGLGKFIDVGVVKSGLEATIARHPRFCSIPVLDELGSATKSKWVRTKVVIEDHIIIPDLNAGNDGSATASSDQVVENYVSSLTSTPMDHSRPLWDLHVLDIPTSEAAAVAVFRVHHSLGDCTSLMSLLLACTRKASDPNSLPTIPGGDRRQRSFAPPRPNAKVRLTFAILTRLWAFLIFAWNTLVDVLFIGTAIFFKDTPTALAVSDGVELRPSRVVQQSVSLDDIKDIKKAMGCTVNDVLLGVTFAGLSRYLRRRYEKSRNGGDEKKKNKEFQSSIRLRSILVANVRPVPGIHDLAKLMEGKDGGTKWGNRIGYMMLPFTVSNCKDPLDYVRRGKAIADRKKNSLGAIFTYKSVLLLDKLFGIKVPTYLFLRVLKHTTFTLSNMVGPVEKIDFFGHPLVYITPTVTGHPQALIIHCLSYMNVMKMVVAVDEEVISDPRQLLDDFVESLKLMKETIPINP